MWIESDIITFIGTRCRPNGVDESGKGTYYVQYMFDWGYADNMPNETDVVDHPSEFMLTTTTTATSHITTCAGRSSRIPVRRICSAWFAITSSLSSRLSVQRTAMRTPVFSSFSLQNSLSRTNVVQKLAYLRKR